MNAHVLTTTTSAPAVSRLISCPAACAMPSMTSPSTTFLGQPSEMKPILIGDWRLAIGDYNALAIADWRAEASALGDGRLQVLARGWRGVPPCGDGASRF